MPKVFPLILIGLLAALGILYLENVSLKKEITNLNQTNAGLKISSQNAESKIDLLSQNSFEVGEIKKCMYRSTIRSQAIHQSIYSNTSLTPAEKNEYISLLPVVEKNKNSSSEVLLMALISESAKIDDECLEYAKRVISG